jgi:transposase
MNKEQVYCGVDVAKGNLDVALGEQRRRLSNDGVGHRQLVRWLVQSAQPVQVICEASGGYSKISPTYGRSSYGHRSFF